MARKNEQELIAFGNNMRERREALGLSQDDVADRTNLSGNAISRYELGTSEPGALTFHKIAKALETNADNLAPGAYKAEPAEQTEIAKISEAFGKLPEREQAVAYQAIMAMLCGFANSCEQRRH